MINYVQAIILGLLQGVAELFPVSSLGHSVIIPKLLGWSITQNDPGFLIFLVATHFATAIVLLVFFWRDWERILRGIFRSLKLREIRRTDTQAKLGWLLVVGTIPAGIIGILFQDQIRLIFVTARSAALFLFLNGLVLFGAEFLRRRAVKTSDVTTDQESRLAKMSYQKSIGIGAAQTLALIPGFSRTGSAMGGGLLAGLSHEDAAHYSFLLATPIIFAAAVLKLPELFLPQNRGLVGPSLVGGACSAIAAYFAVKFLSRYFLNRTLRPFAIYCLLAGGLSLLYFIFI